MKDEEIIAAAKAAGQKTEFGELVRSPLVRGTFSAYEIGFIEGAEWAREQMPLPEDTLIFKKGVEEGRRLEREDTMTKEEAIIKVLTQRADIARKVLLNHLKDDGQDGVKFAGYLEGKVDGYEQAIELLKEDIECISIELEEEDHHGQGQGDSGN